MDTKEVITLGGWKDLHLIALFYVPTVHVCTEVVLVLKIQANFTKVKHNAVNVSDTNKFVSYCTFNIASTLQRKLLFFNAEINSP